MAKNTPTGDKARLDHPGPAYISKEEKKIPIDDPSGKWSDLTLLPEWGDDVYDVYTVRKYGKWVMLKALKKELADQPKYKAMLEKEFDVRYNLAHPNIVMVNDFEDVPGVGRSIITDDVYGYSLRQMIDEHRLTPKIVRRLETQLLDALDYIESNHIVHDSISPETIIFTEYQENLKLLNVGYDHSKALSEQDTKQDIESYGEVLSEVLDNLPASLPKLRRIADKCQAGGYDSITDVQLAIERRSSAQIYIILCILIAILATILIVLTAAMP